MEVKTFDEIRRFVYDVSGITLGSTKMALVSARLGKRLRALGMQDPKEYLKLLKDDNNGAEVVQFIDAISTNVTSFFREADHFEYLSTLLKKWSNEGQREFTIWCAAASTGEEPYTIAMTSHQALNNQGGRVRILATDISTKVLKRCHEGRYAPDKVDGIPPNLLAQYFDRVRTGTESGMYSVRDTLKNNITFNRLNLSQPPFPMKGPMDVIFIRNVMIYFDNPTRERLLSEAYRLLKDGGHLMVGHSEGLTGLVSDFTLVKSSIYEK